MSKKAPVRCAASFKETYKGVWGDFPNKQNGTPRRCPVFCLWRPKGIACYNMFVYFFGKREKSEKYIPILRPTPIKSYLYSKGKDALLSEGNIFP